MAISHNINKHNSDKQLDIFSIVVKGHLRMRLKTDVYVTIEPLFLYNGQDVAEQIYLLS